jgi:hypothetical protein
MRVNFRAWGWSFMSALGLLPSVCTVAACERSCSKKDDGADAGAASASARPGRRPCEGALFDAASGIESCRRERPGFGGREEFAHRRTPGIGCETKSARERWVDGTKVSIGCLKDQDCGDGFICRCEGHEGGTCSVADCKTDDDCGPNAWCAESKETCAQREFHCQIPEDECLMDIDCGDRNSCQRGRVDHHRTCVPPSVCGRPFLVGNTSRAAELVAQPGWCAQPRWPVAMDGLSDDERARLARHYAEAGLREHASVAAFSRFALQLLSLGAPATLVDACARAMADEVRHARACFELASHYAGRPLGPGPLSTQDCLPSASLGDILALVVVEGCVGETLAALEVAEAAAQVLDPDLRATLERIAADERSHAELSFRFVQ